MRKLLLALALMVPWAALAQPLSPNALTGSETWTCAVGGPQGPSTFCTANLLRNTVGYVTTATATGTVTATTSAVRYIFTAALTGGITLNTPATPFDGEMIEVANGTGSAFTQTITLTGVGGQTVNSGAVATLAASGSAEWMYAAANTTWYRMR